MTKINIQKIIVIIMASLLCLIFDQYATFLNDSQWLYCVMIEPVLIYLLSTIYE